ncbi:MAG: hypothetical protein CVU91_09090 [Firmicutes bacterium HGW-Firmicutes-16]|nr:MAG: hypothetical protein CVU91_09090 [Firmicutes bacterium HGW-Firmicutes-16]
MTTSEKVAYLKGLADGLGLDKENKQDKLLAAIIDVLETVALDLDDLEENALDLADELDAISDDLSDIEEIVYNDYAEDDDECCCGGDHGDYEDACCCGGDHHHGEDSCCGGDPHHGEESCCCGHHHDEPIFYEVMLSARLSAPIAAKLLSSIWTALNMKRKLPKKNKTCRRHFQGLFIKSNPCLFSFLTALLYCRKVFLNRIKSLFTFFCFFHLIRTL